MVVTAGRMIVLPGIGIVTARKGIADPPISLTVPAFPPVPIACRGSRVGDLPAPGQGCRAPPRRLSVPPHRARRAAVEPAGGLGRQRKRDGRVVGLLDVGQHRQRTACGGIGRLQVSDAAFSGADAGPVPYMPPGRSPPINRTRLRRLAPSPNTDWCRKASAHSGPGTPSIPPFLDLAPAGAGNLQIGIITIPTRRATHRRIANRLPIRVTGYGGDIRPLWLERVSRRSERLRCRPGSCRSPTAGSATTTRRAEAEQGDRPGPGPQVHPVFGVGRTEADIARPSPEPPRRSRFPRPTPETVM